ncbi:MAG: hypothetical protein HY286_08755 [Planctomycetes bacterium]|nr:hypothetical protein [Planctomycetota bacterium]
MILNATLSLVLSVFAALNGGGNCSDKNGGFGGPDKNGPGGFSGKIDINASGSISPLTPLVASPAQSASGVVEIDSGWWNFQGFGVRAKGLPTSQPPGPFEVWLADSTGTFFKVANMWPWFDGDWILQMAGYASAPAGLGVANVSDLANRAVQVRDAGGANVYLQGTIGGASGGGAGSYQIGIISLSRPATNPPDADAAGIVKMIEKPGKIKFETEGFHLDTDSAAAYKVFIENSAGANTYYLVGAMALENAGFHDEWELELTSTTGVPVELNVANLSDLGGRNLQIHDKNDAVVLSGLLPALASTAAASSSKSGSLNAAGKTNARGKVILKYDAPHGATSIQLKATNLAVGNGYNVFVETKAGGGVFTNAGALSLSGNKSITGLYRRDSSKGQTLPLGLSTASQLTSRKIQIRDNNNQVVLAGEIP